MKQKASIQRFQLAKRFRISLRSLLITSILVITFFVLVLGPPIRQGQAIKIFQGISVGGEILESEPNWFSNITPTWVQKAIGIEYFINPTSVRLKLHPNKVEQGRQSITQDVSLAIESLSKIPSVKDLTFVGSGDQIPTTLDLKPLTRLRNLQTIEAFKVNFHCIKQISLHIQAKELCLVSCNLTPSSTESLSKNTHITKLHFWRVNAPAASIPPLKNMKQLSAITFSSCNLKRNQEGSFDIVSSSWSPPKYIGKPPPPVFTISLDAATWLNKQIPQVKHISRSPGW